MSLDVKRQIAELWGILSRSGTDNADVLAKPKPGEKDSFVLFFGLLAPIVWMGVLRRWVLLMTTRATRTAALSVIDQLERRCLLAGMLPDVTWGDAGFAASSAAQIEFCRILPDGKTLALADAASRAGIAVVKYNPNGTLDLSYGNDGARTQIQMPFADIHAVTTQSDGKMLITGGNDQILFVARLNPDGRIDSTFGANGLADHFSTPEIIEGSIPSAPLGGIVVQSDGSILAAGSVYHSFQDHNSPVAALVRLHPNGTLDTTFGDGGLLRITNVEAVRPRSMMLQGDGKVVLIGDSPQGAYMARLNPDGSADTTFGGGDGFVLTDIPGGNDAFRSLLILNNGKILVGGGSVNSVGSFHPIEYGLPVVMRFNSDGSPDATFGDGGTFTTLPTGGLLNYDDGLQLIQSLATDSQGNIIAAARGQDGSGTLILYRLTANGAPDTTFAPNGKLQVAKSFYPTSVSFTPDGRIVVTGSTATAGAIARVSIRQPAELGGNGTLYVRGTDAADMITLMPNGANLALTLNGVPSNYIAAEVNSVDIDTGAGNDVIEVTAAVNCFVRAGAGNDSVSTSTGNDQVVEPITGSGRDTIRTSDGNDSIEAGDGNDRIVAGSGQMTISGSAGDDNITAGNGRMLIDGGTGHDSIETGLSDRSTITSGTGNDNIHTTGDVTVISGPKNSTSESDDDIVVVLGGRARIEVGYGNNQVTVQSSRAASVGGGPGNDLIITGSGNDHIDPLGGNDTVFSNAGDDYITQLGDSDYVDSGSGNDTISSGNRGAPARDEIHAASGNDYVSIQGGGLIDLGSGDDVFDARRFPGTSDPSPPVTVYGRGGNDSIIGSDSSDFLNGGGGNDTLVGGTGADRLYGGQGRDNLQGGGGNDRFFSNDGEPDVLDGGPGTDSFDADELDELLRLESSM